MSSSFAGKPIVFLVINSLALAILNALSFIAQAFRLNTLSLNPIDFFIPHLSCLYGFTPRTIVFIGVAIFILILSFWSLSKKDLDLDNIVGVSFGVGVLWWLTVVSTLSALNAPFHFIGWTTADAFTLSFMVLWNLILGDF